MDPNLQQLREKLVVLDRQMRAVAPSQQAIGLQSGNWTFPLISGAELADHATELISLIDAAPDSAPSPEQNVALADHIRRIQFLCDSVVPNIPGNAAAGVPSFLFTLQHTRTLLGQVLRPSSDDTSHRLKRAKEAVRAIESRVTALEPRTHSLSSLVERIESAGAAADQLPTDLQSLIEAREEITTLKEASNRDHTRIEDNLKKSIEVQARLQKVLSEAELVLVRCETAYSAATSVGLAAAFTERSRSLANSVWVWVGLLVGALLGGAFVGHQQFGSLSEAIAGAAKATITGAGSSTDAVPFPTGLLLLRLALALISVGAPIWFSWLATKQIGQRFRLAEDYAFKASVARAYEGFRRETERVDAPLGARLLASALARLDELPGRLVEPTSHGSPWHELISSDSFRDAIRLLPDFPDRVRSFAQTELKKAKSAQKADDNKKSE